MTPTAADREAAASIREAGDRLNKLIHHVQDKLATWIIPDSRITDSDCLNELLEIMDGFEQRAAQKAWFDAKKDLTEALAATRRAVLEESGKWEALWAAKLEAMTRRAEAAEAAVRALEKPPTIPT